MLAAKPPTWRAWRGSIRLRYDNKAVFLSRRYLVKLTWRALHWLKTCIRSKSLASPYLQLTYPRLDSFTIPLTNSSSCSIRIRFARHEATCGSRAVYLSSKKDQNIFHNQSVWIHCRSQHLWSDYWGLRRKFRVS